MKHPQLKTTAAAAALAALLAVSAAQAGPLTPFSSFAPLVGNVAAGSLPETAPLQLASTGWTQRSVANRNATLAAGQFNSGNWDMIDTNRNGAEAGRYLFTVFETSQAGVMRYDRQTGATATLWHAPVAAPAAGAAVAFDASRWTPWGTYLTAEESWGTQPQPYGRLFELSNPTTATASTGTLLHRNAIARVSHEGLAFDKQNNLYFIDELNGGSIYKFTSATPNNGATFFDAGVNSVLRIGDGSVDNAVGSFNWVAFTDSTGAALASAVTVTDPNGVTSVDGRATTDTAAFKGTNYQRPEDLEIKTLANGEQVLYVATTTTNEVYSINLSTGVSKRFVTRSTLNAGTGLAVGAELTSPDNLAIDADGNLYIIEDQPGGAADIWMATDANDDGIAESISKWASLSTVGAEPTGLYFDIFNPALAYVNVQHPTSGNDQLIEIAAVPEPTTPALVLGALGALAVNARRQKKA